MRLLAVAALAFLAVPGIARAADARIVSRDVPLDGRRTLAATTATARFDLVGLHWRGPGSVLFRTRTVDGHWSRWLPAAPEAEDAPNPDSSEAARARRWRLGNPYWTGPSDRIEFRLRGRVTRLRAWLVRSPEERIPLRSLAMPSSPPIIPRLSWSANERIRRAPPAYADALRFALVHHTAGSNRYSRAQSASIVRAIQLYHVLGNGWNDVGYNFLVDRYGQVFEGRAGGVDRNVVGAHAQGFNTGSVGVAVLGNYGGTRVPVAVEAALGRLLAWRLDLAHVDPASTLTWLSGGNPRFPTGTPVFLRAISGHRDAGFTACPGNALYARINAIARRAAALGLPKLYDPVVQGSIPRPVRFTARLSDALPWTLALHDPAGASVAVGSGIGPVVDWTWDASGALPGRYSYVLTAGPTVRPAFGTFGGRPPPLRLTGVTAVPTTISPDGDGIDDSSTVTYTLSVTATVTAMVLDAAGATVATLFTDWKPAGSQAFVFGADGIPDGLYTIVLRAVGADGKAVTARVAVTVARVPAGGPR